MVAAGDEEAGGWEARAGSRVTAISIRVLTGSGRAIEACVQAVKGAAGGCMGQGAGAAGAGTAAAGDKEREGKAAVRVVAGKTNMRLLILI